MDPGCSALLVVDMQQYFASLCEPIIKTVSRVVAASRVAKMLVLFTQHGHADPDVDGGMLADWWGDLIEEGSEGHALIGDIGVQPADRIIAKRRYSAFWGTSLASILAQRGVSDLTVVGVMTNLCVETTVREAFVRDLRVRVLMDGTATASDQMQQAALLNMAFGFAHVQTVQGWLSCLGD
jgi:nicotinamidase-related amidase